MNNHLTIAEIMDRQDEIIRLQGMTIHDMRSTLLQYMEAEAVENLCRDTIEKANALRHEINLD